MNKPPFMVRQGDVLLVEVPMLPEGAKVVPATRGLVILARGEQTGHCHYVAELEAAMLEANEAMRQIATAAGITDTRVVIAGLEVKTATTLWHGTPTLAPGGPKDADHDPIVVPAGRYVVVAPKEYTGEDEDWRRVAD